MRKIRGRIPPEINPNATKAAENTKVKMTGEVRLLTILQNTRVKQ